MGTPGMESVSTEPELRNYQSAAGDWKATPTQVRSQLRVEYLTPLLHTVH